MPLLAALGTALGVLAEGVGWRCVVASYGRFPAAWDREKFGCLLVVGILGGDVVHLLGGVPKNVVRCPFRSLCLPWRGFRM
jgi:hypothetical protein